MINEYIVEECLALLEALIPSELFEEVLKYIPTNEDEEKMSQSERVLKHLMDHGEITNLQCHLLYGIRHCPAVIRDVKKKLQEQNSPYYIDTRPAKGCDRYGEKTNWVVYFITQKTDSSGQYKLFA